MSATTAATSSRSLDGQHPAMSWAGWLSAAAAIGAVSVAALGRTPGWPELAAFVAWHGGLVAASSSPRLAGFHHVYSRAPNPTDVVALTFDDGPDPTTTPQVLDTLAAHGARATFFMIGEKVERHPELVRAVADAGHQVANHGQVHHWSRVLTPERARENIERCDVALSNALGRPMAPPFRPPHGVTTPGLGSAVRTLDRAVIGWSVRTFDSLARGDWRARAARTLERTTAGDVVLMHDAPMREGGRAPHGPAMLPTLLEGLDTRGLRCLTVDACFGAASVSPG